MKDENIDSSINETNIDSEAIPADLNLLPDGATFRAPLSIIDPLPCGNIRRRRSKQAYQELREQILIAKGVIQSVTVRVDPDDSSRLQLIAGYGRTAISNEMAYDTIPVVLKKASLSEAIAMMASENNTREALSIADEAVMAQQMVNECGGDVDIAAKALGWTVRRTKGRLLLNQCSHDVLEALFEHPHLIGHAEVLSKFTKEKQDATIIKIINEKWSLEKTKQRAGKAVRFLNHAIFDTTDCVGCPNNTTDQADLFNNTVGSAKCANLICYKEKTDVVIESRRKEVEEEYGVTLIVSESHPSTRKTITGKAVGEDQFANGCKACVSNIAVIEDSIERTAGSIIKHQCIDSLCYSKKVSEEKSRQLSNIDIKVQKSEPKPKNSEKKTDNKTTTLTDSKPKKLPSAVVEFNKNHLRKLSAESFCHDFRFHDAMGVSSLIWSSGFHRHKDIEKFGISTKSTNSFYKILSSVYALEMERIIELKKATSAFVILKKEKNCPNLGDIEDLMILMLSEQEDEKEKIRASWKPSEDLLNKYQKGGIEVICTESGFDCHYDEKHKEGAFAALCKSKKNLIAGILSTTSFSWEQYAPEHFLELLKIK